MDDSVYFQGLLVTTATLAVEHLLLYKPLGLRGNNKDRWRVLAKFVLGVSAILMGCFVIRWQDPYADPFLTPLACSCAGLVIILAYVGREIFERTIIHAKMRGYLHGLADRADIAEDDGRNREPNNS
jgi:hypothetical protein